MIPSHMQDSSFPAHDLKSWLLLCYLEGQRSACENEALNKTQGLLALFVDKVLFNMLKWLVLVLCTQLQNQYNKQYYWNKILAYRHET